jgi:hypothetical protein
MARDLRERLFLPLNLARLPVPPLGHCWEPTEAETKIILRGAFAFVNAGGGCGDFDLLPGELSVISWFSGSIAVNAVYSALSSVRHRN